MNAITDPTEAQQTEERALVGELKTCEVEYRDALQTEGDEHATVPVDAADREYREVLGRGNVGRIMTAFVEHRAVDGAEAEVQQHRGLNANQIPLDMLRLPVEHRAVTTGPPNTSARRSNRRSCRSSRGAWARSLGADRPTVDAGTVAYPVLDQRPDVGGPHTDSTSIDETTGSFSSSLLTPGRIQASYFYKRTDAARFASLDMALRLALNSGLEEKLDQELIAGSEGLLTGTNLADHAAAAVTSFALYRVAVRPTGASMAGTRRDSRMSGPSWEVRRTRTWAISTGRIMPTTAHSTQSTRRQAASRCRHTFRRSRRKNRAPWYGSAWHDRAVLQVLWDGVSLIPDEITKAKTGEVAITAILLVATKILRSDSFYKQETQHAA